MYYVDHQMFSRALAKDNSREQTFRKVEKIFEDSLDSIPSPSPSVKIQIIGGKVYLR